MGVEEAYRWKDSVQSEAEIRIWFADGVAQRPAALVHQVRRRCSAIVAGSRSSRNLYRWHHGAERYLGTRSRWRG